MDQDMLVFFQGNFVPIHDAKVSILTHALHYGTGVFEGIRGYWEEGQKDLFLVRPEEHYQRWKSNCGILLMDLPLRAKELVDLTIELVRRNKFRTNLYIRPLAYKSAERIGVHPDQKADFALIAMPFGDYIDSQKGIHAGVVSWRRIQDNAIPGRAKICGAYVNSALASDEARLNGYDEGIFLTESGYVAEGAACNIFIVRDGKLITPPVTENILEGITRSAVMELARNELHVDVVERPVNRSELYVADEVFFTGTAVEICPISRVDHRPVGLGGVGPVTTALRQLYTLATRGRLPAYQKWVVPVYHDLTAQRAA